MITTYVDLVKDINIFNNIMLVYKYAIYFISCLMVWISSCPSFVLTFLKDCVHDLEVVGNSKVDQVITSLVSLSISKVADAIFIPLSNFGIETPIMML